MKVISYSVVDWLGKDNQLGIDIYYNKYRYKDETFDDWLDRISGGDENLRELIFEKKFLFGGRILANRGTGNKATMMNCYASSFVEDSLDDIMSVNTKIAKTFKAQGGQGLSLSKIRPKGTGINNGQFKSDGIIPFMEIFNTTTASISQGGSRKGALLMSLDAWHKEAKDFITIKSEQGKITKANLSLEIDDQFINDVKEYYKTGKVIKREITRDYNGNKVTYEVTPIEVYKLMMKNAWNYAEPGCIFTNQFRNYNIGQYVEGYTTDGCNPCGEQSLPKDGACCLGSINLSEFVENPFTEDAKFNMYEFCKAVSIGIEALDKIVDENKDNHAIQAQRDMSLKYRNIGLGVMGLYDAMVKMNIVYGSQESIDFCNSIFNMMFKQAVRTSSQLAKFKGAFPEYSDKVWESDIIRNHFSEEEIEELKPNKLRNIALLSIAPVGSISTMLNVSSGCEPLYSIGYTRKTESLNHGEDKYYTVFSGIVKDYLKLHPEIKPDINSPELKKRFVTAMDIDWHDRVKIQSALQKHVDAAISSTVNLKKDISIDEIEKLYLYAWEMGLKGITIFRDGCKRTGILTTDNTKTKEPVKPKKVKNTTLVGKKRKLNSGCGRLHALAYFDRDTGELKEVFLNKGSQHGCNAFMNGLARMISLSARSGVDIYTIVDQLKSVPVCASYAVRYATKKDTSKGANCPMAVGNCLLEMYDEMQKEIDLGLYTETIERDDDSEEPCYDKDIESVIHEDESSDNVVICPKCGSKNYIPANGCWECKDCGYSRCD